MANYGVLEYVLSFLNEKLVEVRQLFTLKDTKVQNDRITGHQDYVTSDTRLRRDSS